MGETRYDYERAYSVAAIICQHLRPACVRVQKAGSLRRHKKDVGDIEILYIPLIEVEADPSDMFRSMEVNRADIVIEQMERAGILDRRLNAKGSQMFGSKNKLMRHVSSGIPVDLFSATEENWFNYLVCRTGPADLNKRICEAAIAKGWHWNPYGVGFSNDEEVTRMDSEEAVFSFVGLPYHEPARRI